MEVDLLLELAAERGARLLADNGQDRLVIEPRVVKPVQEMNRARTGGREAHAELAGELGVRAGHERRQLLMPRLDEFELVAGACETAHQANNAVSRIPEDAADAPFGHAFPEEIGDVHGFT